MFFDPSDKNQLYHTPLLFKIWVLTENKKIVNNPFKSLDIQPQYFHWSSPRISPYSSVPQNCHSSQVLQSWSKSDLTDWLAPKSVENQTWLTPRLSLLRPLSDCSPASSSSPPRSSKSIWSSFSIWRLILRPRLLKEKHLWIPLKHTFETHVWLLKETKNRILLACHH